jgi:hypothetical protein
MANFNKVLLLISSVFTLLTLSCSGGANGSRDSIPSVMRPNWEGINVDSLPVKFGQILRFEKDTNSVDAIVLDFDKDEKGIWVGLCLLNKNRLFGRQIPSGLVNTGCIDLLDLTYLNIEALEKYKEVELLNIKREEVGIGSIAPALSLEELHQSFEFGVDQRKKKQTPCNTELTNSDAIRECYFELEKIKN